MVTRAYDWHAGSSALVSEHVKRVCVMVGLLQLTGRGGEVPHPIAAENRLEGRDCQGWRLRHRVSDSEAALYWPALEGYIIRSG